MTQELAGKVAIVTGGASGIGRGTVEMFVAEGAKVVVADVNPEGEALADGLGPTAVFQRTDVSRAEEIQALVDFAVERFGGLHVMVNNAGIGGAPFEHFLDDTLEDFDRVIGINLRGVMLGTQRAARHMARHGGGSIINLASIAGLLAGYGVMSYRASKAGVIQFTKSVAIDLAEHGVRVNCLCPGHIRTPMNAFSAPGVSAETAERLAAAMAPVWDASKPLKRQGRPEDVAQAAVFLASDRAAQITGVIMPVDGGIVAGDPVNHLAGLMAARARVLES